MCLKWFRKTISFFTKEKRLEENTPVAHVRLFPACPSRNQRKFMVSNVNSPLFKIITSPGCLFRQCPQFLL